jgi:hypothetical protein
VKPSISSSGELGFSSGSEEDAWKKESEDEVDYKCFYSHVCSLKTRTVKNGFDDKNV